MTSTEIIDPAHRGAIATIGAGVREAPALRDGLPLTLTLAAIGASGRVAVPILVQQAIDKGFESSGGESLVHIGTVTRLGVIGFIWLVVAAIAQRTAVARLGRRSETALYALRVRLFDHIHRISLEDHNDEKRGALVARVTSDVETLTQFFSWGGIAYMLDGALMLIVAGVMLSYDWMLAIIVFVVSAPLALVLRKVQKHLVSAYDRTREANSMVLGTASELVTGAETLRAYKAGPEFASRARHAAGRRADAQVKASLIGAFLFPSGEVFGVFAVSAVIATGVWRGPASGLTSGALVGFVFLTYRFLEPIAELTEVLDQTQTAVSGLRRVLGVLEIPVGPPPPTHPSPLPRGPLDIVVDHVSFKYRPRDDEDEEQSTALNDLSLTVPFGTQIAIVGETGSGKTTLGRLLARFTDPTIGSIRLGGVELTRVANHELRTRLVVVPQEPFLFDDTVAANLRFSQPDVEDSRLLATFDDLGLSDWLESLGEGLDTRVGQRGAQISAGERQLVALVRAALVNPSILILDEATSSVDPLTEVRISRAIERLAKGRTTIAIAHRLSTAARADRVLVLDHGRLVEDGTHDELVKADGVYSRMYRAWISSTSTHKDPD